MSPVEYKFLKQNIVGKPDEVLFSFIYLSYETLGKQFEDFFKSNFKLSPSQTHVLCYLKFYQKISMSELAELMNSSRQHMTKLVDSLVERGLAIRSYDEKDRRAVYVEPTEMARKDIDTGERRFISHLQRNISCLPEDKQKELMAAIRTTSEFLANLKIEVNSIPDVLK